MAPVRNTTLVLALLAAGATAAPALDIIVNAGNPVSQLDRDVVSKIFLKKATRWPGGEVATPVDQDAASAVRAEFSKLVHRRPASAVAAHWQREIFAGRDVPPAEKASDAAVIEFVKSHPGAIGYISGGATSGVKVIGLR